MNTSAQFRMWCWLFPVVASALGCYRTAGTPAASESVNVFVAASTKDVVKEIANAFKAERGIDVRINADDSSKLAAQIAEGAPAHLFLSANEQWANFVKDKGLVEETVPLLGNSLVIVAPRGNPGGVHNPDDLSKAAVK